MRFAVVDDEKSTLNIISNLILQFTNNNKMKIDCYTSAQSFLIHYVPRNYDAIFLDIDMPEITGFKLTEILHEKQEDIPIVYVTGRDDLITNAFRYKPIGFVRKPRLESELQFAIETLYSEFNKNQSFISVTEPKSYGGHSYNIQIKNILYIEASKHYLSINLLNEKVITVRDKISNYTNNPAFKNFVLINTGTMVNLAHIKVVHDTVKFPNGNSLYISRRRIQNVLQAYLKYEKKVLI